MRNNRYARQTILAEIGEGGQAQLLKSSVLCIGAGGLGCPALFYLAAAGIGHIGIVDFDNVDETNLHRQVLYTMDDVGKNKALAAKERLLALNPDINIMAYSERLTAENVENLCKTYDIIIDGSDNFTTKYLINDACVKFKKPFVYGAVTGFKGQISVFDMRGDNNSCYRCLFPESPKTHIPNCAEAGIIGASAGIIGTIQAMEAIKLIVPHDDFAPLTNTLMTIDTRTMKVQNLHLRKHKHCPVCSKNPKEIILMDEPKTIICGVVPEISVAEAKRMKDAVFVDVREDDEWDTGHIEGALHLPLSALYDGTKTPDDLGLNKDQDIILYCRSGQRSLTAGHLFIGHGYGQVYNLTGGILAWD